MRRSPTHFPFAISSIAGVKSTPHTLASGKADASSSDMSPVPHARSSILAGDVPADRTAILRQRLSSPSESAWFILS